MKVLVRGGRLLENRVLRSGPRPVNDIGERLQLNQPQVSKHLRVLKEAGLVEVQPRAQQRLYELRAQPLRQLRDWLERYRHPITRLVAGPLGATFVIVPIGIAWNSRSYAKLPPEPQFARTLPMDTMLFSQRSIWTMIHGIVLGGGALMALSAALFSLRAMRTADASGVAAQTQSTYLAWLIVFTAVVLWLTVLVGTYVSFPPYRATPPEGVTDLSQYPRSLIQSNPGTVWLHAFAMEIKEHVPWIAAMLATAVAFVGVRYRSRLVTDAQLRGMATTLLAICFVLVSFVAILGVFINKVAPLE